MGSFAIELPSDFRLGPCVLKLLKQGTVYIHLYIYRGGWGRALNFDLWNDDEGFSVFPELQARNSKQNGSSTVSI